MVKPGLLATVVPVLIGLIFKVIGTIRGDAFLGAKAVAGLLMFSTVSGVMMSLYMNNAGGAWDNAKKLVETGQYGGKHSEAHNVGVAVPRCIMRYVVTPKLRLFVCNGCRHP